jgi:hypothetical protein
VARSEGGGVEVDSGGVTVTKSDTRMASRRGRQHHTLRLGSRRRCAPGPRSRTAGGDSTDD